ncbi:sigma 54-interacting transcriptional regulator [Lawsonibacter celer]|jgi:transcriptional regulator with PAS, ATPase and Fis domain|uniref:sigma 54-interacting transcriptional regulator n=1 Tax=Lawsonibacter celer TaxID=2986526 RepID=UPI001645ED66
MEFNTHLFPLLLDYINIGIFILDADGYYLYVNQPYCDLTLHSKKFFYGKTISWFQQEGYLTRSVYDQVLQTRSLVQAVVTITDRDNNRLYDTLTTGAPIFDESGALKYIFYTQETLSNLHTRLQRGMMNKSTSLNLQIKIPSASPPVDIIAESPQMKQLVSLLATVSKTDASVLVSGPSGSGKEVIARHIHRSSRRSEQPFVVLNCAAIPENLMESELFGYDRGAFTGAAPTGKPGLVEMANGGTLFLDEINSMPMALQTKLLRVLETRQVTRVGAVSAKEIDFRLICASNEDLLTLVGERRFREDLFYRINVISVHIPPLRERREDIIPLTLHYLRHYCKKYTCVKIFTEQVLEDMRCYDWPGNVRELKNFIERMIITSPEPEWLIESVPPGFLSGGQPVAESVEHPVPHTGLPSFEDSTSFSFRAYMDACERDLLVQALDRLHTPAAAAKALKLDLSSVYRKLQKYHLSPRPEKSAP